jgi:hypothetical protein
MKSELARRIVFTLGALLVYRLGTYIPLSGVAPVAGVTVSSGAQFSHRRGLSRRGISDTRTVARLRRGAVLFGWNDGSGCGLHCS